MNKVLHKLDEKMNETVMKDIVFDKKQKDDVFRKIKQGASGKRTLSIRKLIHSVLGVLVPIALASVLFTFINIEKRDKTDTTNLKEQPVIKQELDRNEVYTPQITKESYDDLTKGEVYNKLLSDNKFETAKGAFEMFTIPGGQQHIEYQVINSKEVKRGYSNLYNTSSTGKHTLFSSDYYVEDTTWRINHEHKNYFMSSYTPIGTLEIGLAKSSLFPVEIVQNYMGDAKTWEIEKQNEEYIGHNTVVVYGTLNEYASAKHKSSTFRFWVDKDSGILLKYETYDSEGKVINYLRSTEVTLNKPMETNSFTPNLKGYSDYLSSLK